MFLFFPLRRYAIAGTAGAILALTIFSVSPRAQDASFGCKFCFALPRRTHPGPAFPIACR